MKSKFLSPREIEYLNSSKEFVKQYGKEYAYSIKSRILKKYHVMKDTIQYIELHVDAKTLQKLLHPKKEGGK